MEETEDQHQIDTVTVAKNEAKYDQSFVHQPNTSSETIHNTSIDIDYSDIKRVQDNIDKYPGLNKLDIDPEILANFDPEEFDNLVNNYNKQENQDNNPIDVQDVTGNNQVIDPIQSASITQFTDDYPAFEEYSDDLFVDMSGEHKEKMMENLNESAQMFETYGLDFEKFINDGPDNWGFALSELDKKVKSDYDIRRLKGLKILYRNHKLNNIIFKRDNLINSSSRIGINTNFNIGPSDTIR